MKLKIIRAFHSEKAILGMLKVEGIDHQPIFTLENPLRATLEDSAIPNGKYKCKPHSGTKYQNVWEVCNVPGRSAILIHWGNTEKDTRGCILVGLEAGMLISDPAVKSSKLAVELLRKLIGAQGFELEVT